MSTQIFDPNNASVTLSPEAASHIKKRMNSEEKHHMLLSVEKTGCSGYGYKTTLITAPEDQHINVENNASLSIYITKEALPMLRGTEIDLEKKSLGHTVLVYKNPNETGKCGCGASFTIDDRFSGDAS